MGSKSKKILLMLALVFAIVSCGSNVEEADYNYQNAMEHYSQINKNPEKRKDALYFFNLAAKNDKYKTVGVARYIYKLAAEILIANKNITIDEKFELTKNILDGIEILISQNETINDLDKNVLREEAENITNSDEMVYVTIRKILNEQSKDDLSKIKLLLIDK